MSVTQVHIVDAAAALILIVCSDGSRVLFGSHAGSGTPNEAVQRIFEILEDGDIDYLVHEAVEPQGVPVIEPLVEFFSIKSCLEREGAFDDAPQYYRNIRIDRRVETLSSSEVFELGKTQIRLLQAEARPGASRRQRPVALHVMHGENAPESAVICCGATTGVDWLQIVAEDTDLKAAALVIDGRRPLDLVLTSRERGQVTADPLRAIAPSSVFLGAEAPGGATLRSASRELFGHFARGPGGAGLVELDRTAWTALSLDGLAISIQREERPMIKAA